MSDWSKPIVPPRCASGIQAPKPLPANFQPVMKLAVGATAARYSISRDHAKKWFREWQDGGLRDRDIIIMRQEDKPQP